MLRICPVCGRNYDADPVRLSHGRQTTCGRTCSYKLRAAKTTKSVPAFCSTCGSQFLRCPSHAKSKHEGVYCSRQCHYAGRSAGTTKRIVSSPYVLVKEYDRKAAGKKAAATRKRLGNHRHGEATREKLRLAAAAQIARRGTRQVSKIEEKVAEELVRIGVAHERQIAIRHPVTGRFCALVDFRLSPTRVIEVNGTFWHADPRFYPDGPQSPAQLRTADRYRKKIAALDELGIEVVEIWEADIDKDVVQAVATATLAHR